MNVIFTLRQKSFHIENQEMLRVREFVICFVLFVTDIKMFLAQQKS